MIRTVPVPRYECPTCGKRFKSVKSDGQLRKHGSCPSGLTPIDHGESWKPWVGQRTPASSVPKCERPPFPTDADRNARTLWLGSGWTDCHVLEVETRHRRRVCVLVRDGDFIAFRARDGEPVRLDEKTAKAAEQAARRNRESEATWKRWQKEVAATGVDWRRVSGDVRLVSVRKQKAKPYTPRNAQPAYQRVWEAHVNLAELLMGGVFTRTAPKTGAKSEVNVHRLLAACGDGHLATYNASDPEALTAKFIKEFRADFQAAQPWAWWRQFYAKQAWGAFERLALRPMMSYGDARRSPGRSCVRVLAEMYINQPSLF